MSPGPRLATHVCPQTPPVSRAPFSGAHLCPQAPLAPTGLHLAAYLCPHDPPVRPGPHLTTHRSPTRPMRAVGLPLRDAFIAAGFFDGVFLLSGRGSRPLRGHVTGRCPRWCEPRALHGARASGPGGARWRAAGGQITPAPARCSGSKQLECGQSSGLYWGWSEGRYPAGWYRGDCGRTCVAGGDPGEASCDSGPKGLWLSCGWADLLHATPHFTLDLEIDLEVPEKIGSRST